MKTPWVIIAVIGLVAALAIGACAGGCGSGAATSTTAATLAPGSLGTAASTTSTAAGAGPNVTDITLAPTPASLPADGGSGGPTLSTLPNTGTTVGGPGEELALTFVGPMTQELWNTLRTTVNKAADDYDKIRTDVAKLTAGADVSIKQTEFDRFSGIGFSAGAGVSQPLAIATGSNGEQILVFAFTVTGKPAKTTIAGFDLQSGHVGLVVGPLKITDQTKNITTIPGQ